VPFSAMFLMARKGYFYAIAMYIHAFRHTFSCKKHCI